MQAARQVDDRSRLTLPPGFANATVVIEVVSGDEIHIKRATVVPVEEYRFREESTVPLSDVDRDLFLAALENPPEPNDALRGAMKAAREVGKKNG